MLTTARAIVLAGLLALLGGIGHAMLPRYEIREIDSGAGFVRVDRWKGTAEFTAPKAGTRMADWLTLANRATEQASR